MNTVKSGIRIATADGRWFVHRLHGVVLVSWVSAKDKESAERFPAERGQEWLENLKEMTGMDDLKVVNDDHVDLQAHACDVHLIYTENDRQVRQTLERKLMTQNESGNENQNKLGNEKGYRRLSYYEIIRKDDETYGALSNSWSKANESQIGKMAGTVGGFFTWRRPIY